MSNPLLGIDLGGTKIEVAALSADDGSFLLRERVATPAGYDAILAAIAGLVARAQAQLGVQGLPLGVGIPGCLSPATGLVKGANTTVLNGRALDRDLARLLQRPVRVENDANCLAVSEAVDGAGRGARIVFAVILGTGVGSGIAIDGRVWAGANGIAGEWGHNPAPRLAEDRGLAEPQCWCGRGMCNETLLSGPGLAADHLRHAGAEMDVPAIVAAARAGSAVAQASLARHAERLARAGAGHQPARPRRDRARRRAQQPGRTDRCRAGALDSAGVFGCGHDTLAARRAWRFVGCARRGLAVACPRIIEPSECQGGA